jgi:hypothetical protein
MTTQGRTRSNAPQGAAQTTPAAQSATSSKRLAGAVDPSGKIKLANREKSFQQKIEKMQVALVTRDFRYRKTVAKGLRELVNARKMEELLRDNEIKSLADYTHLRDIYDADLKMINEDDLLREAEAKAEQFLSGGNKVTEQQEQVVRELFSLEAKTNQLGIEQVRDFLILKGEIRETPADKSRATARERLVHEAA